MEIWKVLVVEDSESAIDIMKEHIKSLILYNLTICRTLEEALQALKSQRFDLLFLDIELANNQSGLDLLKIYPNIPPTIITSSHIEYAVDMFDTDTVIDFLPKPFNESRFMRAIRRALKLVVQTDSISFDDIVYLKEGRQMTKFSCSEIVYLKAYGIYTKVYLDTRMVLVNHTITSLCDEILPSKLFRRIHKSYVVNINKLTGFNSKYFYLDKHFVPIGTTFKEEMAPLMKMVEYKGNSDL